MINSNVTKIKTYVGTDGKLHFVDSVGADTVLPFSNGGSTKTYTITGSGSAYHGWTDNCLYFRGDTSISITLKVVDGVLSIVSYSYAITAGFQDDEGHGAKSVRNTGTINLT